MKRSIALLLSIILALPSAYASASSRTGQTDPSCPIAKPPGAKPPGARAPGSASGGVCGVKLSASDQVRLADLERATHHAYDQALLSSDQNLAGIEKSLRQKIAQFPASSRAVAQSLVQEQALAQDHRIALQIATSGPKGAGSAGQAFWGKMVKMQGEASAQALIKKVRSDLSLLKSAGARASAKGHPDLARFDFAKLTRDSKLRAAFARIYPESAGKIDALSSSKRSAVIRLGDQVILPYARFNHRHPGESSPKVIQHSEYEGKLNAGLNAFQSSVRQMLETSKQGGSWKESFGKVISFYSGRKDDAAMSPELVRSAKAHDSAIRSLKYLEDRWGVPRSGIVAMLGELSHAVSAANQNREQVISGIGKKFATVALAPALYPVTTAGMLGSFATGIVLGGSMMIGNAVVSSRMSGESVFCNLGHELNENGADTFLMSLAFAPLAQLGNLAKLGKIGAVSALTVKWGLAGWGAKATYTTLAGTVEAWKEAKRLEAEGYPPEAIQAMKEQAAKGLIASVPDAIQFGRAIRTRVSATRTIEGLKATTEALRNPGESLRTLGAKLSETAAAHRTLAESWDAIAKVRKRGGDRTWKDAEAMSAKSHADAEASVRESMHAQSQADAGDLRKRGLNSSAQLLEAQSGTGGFKSPAEITRIKKILIPRETQQGQIKVLEAEVNLKRGKPEYSAEMPDLFERLAQVRRSAASQEAALSRVQDSLRNPDGARQSRIRAQELVASSEGSLALAKETRKKLASKKKAEPVKKAATPMREKVAKKLIDVAKKIAPTSVVDGKVTKTDKIRDGFEVIHYRDAENTNRMMIKRTVQTAEGPKTVSEEILLDTVSGGINLRSPGAERLAAEIAKTHTGKNNAAVVVIDVNNLGKINSSGGHDTGDLVLKEVFKSIRGVIDQKDLVTRSGGDEFTILLRDVSPEQAKLIQERIVTAVSANTELSKIYRTDRAAIAAELRILNAKLRDTPESSAEYAKLKGQFEKRKKDFDLELRNRPGITPGSSMIGANDSFKSAQSRADLQSLQVKEDLYTRMHWKTDKYQIQPGDKPDLMAKPTVLDPIPGE